MDKAHIKPSLPITVLSVWKGLKGSRHWLQLWQTALKQEFKSLSLKVPFWNTRLYKSYQWVTLRVLTGTGKVLLKEKTKVCSLPQVSILADVSACSGLPPNNTYAFTWDSINKFVPHCKCWKGDGFRLIHCLFILVGRSHWDQSLFSREEDAILCGQTLTLRQYFTHKELETEPCCVWECTFLWIRVCVYEREREILESVQTEMTRWDNTASMLGQGKHTTGQRVHTCSLFSNAVTSLLHNYSAHFPITIVWAD